MRRSTGTILAFTMAITIVACLSYIPACSQPAPQPAPDVPVVDLELRELEAEAESQRIEATIEIHDLTPPEFPEALTRIITPDSAYLEDSIYATEIRTDVGGVLIIDRDGNHVRLMGLGTDLPAPLDEGDRHTGERADVIHVFSNVITIEEDEIINGDVVSIFGGHIEVLGRVNGTVASIFGTINVQGTVEDGAVAPFGTIRIGPRAIVGGDVVASEINKEPGGRIGGLRNELFFKLFGEDWRPGTGDWLQQTFTAVVLLKILFWVFLVLLAHALAARNVAKVKARIAASFVKSFFMGILVQLLFLPAILILFVTIIGIPVAIFLLPLLSVAAVVLANASIGLFLGEKIHENTSIRLSAPLSQTIVGLLAMQIVPLLAVASAWLTAIESIAGIFRIVTLALVGLTAVIGYVVITVGTGAVLTTRFGTRPKDPAPEGAETAASADMPSGNTPGATPLPRGPGDEPGPAPVV